MRGHRCEVWSSWARQDIRLIHHKGTKDTKGFFVSFVSLWWGAVLRQHALRDLRPLRHHHDAAVRYREPLPVRFEVVADRGPLRNLHAFIDDGAADFRMASDLDAVHQDRLID